jgi:ABC-type multidrug transport system permease subunit
VLNETTSVFVETPTSAAATWFVWLGYFVQMYVVWFLLFGHWWKFLCFIFGTVSQLVFDTRASSSDGVIQFS